MLIILLLQTGWLQSLSAAMFFTNNNNIRAVTDNYFHSQFILQLFLDSLFCQEIGEKMVSSSLQGKIFTLIHWFDWPTVRNPKMPTAWNREKQMICTFQKLEIANGLFFSLYKLNLLSVCCFFSLQTDIHIMLQWVARDWFQLRCCRGWQKIAVRD